MGRKIMKFNKYTVYLSIFGCAVIGTMAFADTTEVLMTCGASSGSSYYFKDPIFNPDGGKWMKDGISNGSIMLVSTGSVLDILFSDSIGGAGYKADGAEVVLLGNNDRFFRVGAISKYYVDIYTFDLVGQNVVWTTSKFGQTAPKVAIYEASCR